MGTCCIRERDHGLSLSKDSPTSQTSPLPDPPALHTEPGPIGADLAVAEIRRSDTARSSFESEPLAIGRRSSLASWDGLGKEKLNIRRSSLVETNFAGGLPINKLAKPIESLYTLTRALYKDSSCVVSLAKHLQTGQERLIKRVEKKSRLTRGRSDEAENRFRSEVLLLQLLDHPNILKLYELYEDKHYFYQISEALNGGYLLEDVKIQGKRNISEQLAANIMQQVMKALAYCHSRGIVHRNLRTESILLQSAPQEGCVHVLLTGFGSASLLSVKDKLALKIGSAVYFAPETLLYEPSEKADVWSCGVILHMLLCGNPPFSGATDSTVLEQIASEQQVTFPQALWAGVSSAAINLLRGMLTKHPSARLSLAECLKHSWLGASLKRQTQDPKSVFRALRHLKAFEAKTYLKRTVLSFMAAQIDTPEETKSLRDAFSAIDSNADGLLSKQELLEAYCRIMSREEATYVAEKVMWCVDLNGDGYLDFSEFMLAAKNHKDIMTSSNLRAIFHQFDSNSNGKISFPEFQSALNSHKLHTDDQMWTAILREVDTDGDGELSLKEFSKLMLAAVEMGKGLRRSFQ